MIRIFIYSFMVIVECKALLFQFGKINCQIIKNSCFDCIGKGINDRRSGLLHVISQNALPGWINNLNILEEL